jgi:myo-inositol-1(or 4)-monophosphatase
MNNDLLKTAIEASKRAGEILKQGFGTKFSIKNKEGRHNLVTEFDYKSEQTIIEFISKEVPNSIFEAEESGNTCSINKDAIKWIIDPLDGTVNFAHNIPIFSVSIAALVGEELAIGVVYHPLLNELFTAERGKGSFLNGDKLQVSNTTKLDDSILVTGFPYKIGSSLYNGAQLFIDVVHKGIPIRRLGSAALDLAYVAAGRFDGFWEEELNPWDVAAGVLLVREAGGLVTKYDLSEFSIYSKSILATNGIIHQESSNFLNKRK